MGIKSRDPNSYRRVIFRGVGGLLVVIWFVVTSNTANASCGNYLHHHNHRTEHSLGANDIPSAIALLTKAWPAAPRCSGPECRESSHFPTETPQPVYHHVTLKEQCALLSAFVAIDGRWTSLGQGSNVSRESPDRDRLNRPPQLS
jgi:hypothetical protein